MKIKFIAAALCLTMGLTVFAQNSNTKTPQKEKQPKQCNTEQLAKNLNLTDSQTKEFVKIREEHQAKREAIRQQRSQEKTQRQSEVTTRREEAQKDRLAYQEQVKNILTPDQYTKYQELQKQNRKKEGVNKQGKKHHKGDSDKRTKGCKNGCQGDKACTRK